MLTSLSSPHVIYCDLVMEKLHFLDTWVVMGPIIPSLQMFPLLAYWRCFKIKSAFAGHSNSDTSLQSPERLPHTHIHYPGCLAKPWPSFNTFTAKGCLPLLSNRVSGNDKYISN